MPTDDLRHMVKDMSAAGVPQIDIARVVGVDDKTLRKHYRLELDNATVQANSAVAKSLYEKAVGDGPSAVSAAIFWLKTRAGWREKDREEDHKTEPISIIITRATSEDQT